MSTILFLLTGRKQKKNRNDMKIAFRGGKGNLWEKNLVKNHGQKGSHRIKIRQTINIHF